MMTVVQGKMNCTEKYGNCDWESLPSELKFEILIRVPAFDLVRSKVVCKSWFRLVSNIHAFASSHLQHSKSSQLCIIAKMINIDSTTVGIGYHHHQLTFKIDDETRTYQVINHNLHLPDALPSSCKIAQGTFINALCSCNGIILLSIKSQRRFDDPKCLWVCNPITRSSRLLQFSGHVDCYAWGIGLENFDDLYKVVGYRTDGKCQDCKDKIIILTLLGSDQMCWKGFNEIDSMYANCRMVISTAGRLNWLVNSLQYGIPGPTRVISMDLAQEVLKESTVLPKITTNFRLETLTEDSNGHLHYICVEDTYDKIEMWVMKDWDSMVWIKLCTVKVMAPQPWCSSKGDTIRPIGIISNGKKLIVQHGKQFILYNLLSAKRGSRYSVQKFDCSWVNRSGGLTIADTRSEVLPLGHVSSFIN